MERKGEMDYGTFGDCRMWYGFRSRLTRTHTSVTHTEFKHTDFSFR